jgi:hypothetical protein
VLAGCTTVTQPSRPPDPLNAALTQPLQDLSVIQAQAPALLTRAATQPYQPAGDCAAIGRERADLDAVLGPDVDAPQAEGRGGLAGAVVSGVAALPFRGVVRRITGAHKRDQAVAATVLAGMVRRGYLRGEAAGRACP